MVCRWGGGDERTASPVVWAGWGWKDRVSSSRKRWWARVSFEGALSRVGPCVVDCALVMIDCVVDCALVVVMVVVFSSDVAEGDWYGNGECRGWFVSSENGGSDVF